MCTYRCKNKCDSDERDGVEVVLKLDTNKFLVLEEGALDAFRY